jgi:hypothetical protein
MGTRFEGTFPGLVGPDAEPLGSCEDWTNVETWDVEKRKGFYDLFLAGADAAYVSCKHEMGTISMVVVLTQLVFWSEYILLDLDDGQFDKNWSAS